MLAVNPDDLIYFTEREGDVWQIATRTEDVPEKFAAVGVYDTKREHLVIYDKILDDLELDPIRFKPIGRWDMLGVMVERLAWQ